MEELSNGGYGELLGEIKTRIRTAQYDALRAVNKELISLYWNIGELIVSRQQGETWGHSVVERLAADIQQEFPGIQGFSARSIRYMRDFYVTYNSSQKLPPLAAEIGWSHNRVILDKCKDELEREFYLRMTKAHGWTKNVLIHRIENQTYQKTLTSQTNFDKTLPVPMQAQLALAIKDEYLFDFLELGDEYSERQLETAILAHIEPFLKQMGGVFAFLGSQYRLQVSDQEYFVDILLYHRRLKCLVALELKIGAFLPEYVGKMQFYLAVLDDTVRMPDENPSIGILLCKSKDRTIVEYALRESSKPIGVSTYRMVSSLPAEYAGQLPTPEQIALLLGDVEQE
jgi:predicted nuclease of restriction endonuclease-like (RecB) superfamily